MRGIVAFLCVCGGGGEGQEATEQHLRMGTQRFGQVGTAHTAWHGSQSGCLTHSLVGIAHGQAIRGQQTAPDA